MSAPRLVMFDLDGTLIENFLEEAKFCLECQKVVETEEEAIGPEPSSFDEKCVECGSINLTKRVVPRYDYPYERVAVLPRVKPKLRALASTGVSFAVCTNQGGVALGYQSPGEVWQKMGRAVYALGGFYGRVYSLHAAMHAPTHGRNPLWENPVELLRRKPEPGMLLEALDFHGTTLDHDRSRALFVGDMESDREAAERAGVPFEWAQEFFDQGG